MRHEIVHNKRVVDTLRSKGAIFVEEVDEIPESAVTVFSAHGVAQSVENEADGRDLQVIDATCPLVKKVHKEGQRFAAQEHEVVLIGHRGHPEVEGTMGQIPGRVHLVACLDDVDTLSPADDEKLVYVTQTTLSVDDTRDIIEALKNRFPKIGGPDLRDICYATQNRQMAVRGISGVIDLLLVVGAQNSSNSNRLREIGENEGVPAYLVQDADDVDLDWLSGASSVGITAGASAPEELVGELLDRLGMFFNTEVETVAGVEESAYFQLPPELEAVPPQTD